MFSLMLVLALLVHHQEPVDSGGNKRSCIPSGQSQSSSSSLGSNNKLTDHHGLPEIVLTGCNSLEVSAHVENAQQRDVKNSMYSTKDKSHDGIVGDAASQPCSRCGRQTAHRSPEQKLCSSCSLPNGESSNQNCDMPMEHTKQPSPARSSVDGSSAPQGLPHNGHPVAREAGSNANKTDTISVPGHTPLKRSNSAPVKSAASSARAKQPTDTWKAFKVS